MASTSGVTQELATPSTPLEPSPRVDAENGSPVVGDGHRGTSQKVEETQENKPSPNDVGLELVTPSTRVGEETQEAHVEDKPSPKEQSPRVDAEAVSPDVGDSHRGLSSGQKKKKKKSGNLHRGRDE